jgi:hypothetical protein
MLGILLGIMSVIIEQSTGVYQGYGLRKCTLENPLTG